MKDFSVDFIINACNGTLLTDYADGSEINNTEKNKLKSIKINDFCINSKNAGINSLFIPIVGARNDAHDFINDVYERGCRLTLTQRKDIRLIKGMNYIYVENTVKALQDIAKAHRKNLKLPLIGITGSVGKTTTKEMLWYALSSAKKVFKTPANHNSQIGVPLTLLEIDESYDIGVIELGISEPGEMEKIASLVMPDSAIITNIGNTHILALKSKEGIRDEKFKIMVGMAEGSVIFLNADSDILKKSDVYKGIKKEYYSGRKKCGYYADEVVIRSGLAHFKAHIGDETVEVSLNVYGRHQVSNAVVCLAAAAHYGIDLRSAASKISEFTGFKHRQQIYCRSGITIIDDTYNASPESMKAALDILKDIECSGKKVAVLADMKELGEDAEKMHRDIGRYLVENNIADTILTYGELAFYIFDEAESLKPDIGGETFYDFESLKKGVENTLKNKDAVLFKGSNSMALFRLLENA